MILTYTELWLFLNTNLRYLTVQILGFAKERWAGISYLLVTADFERLLHIARTGNQYENSNNRKEWNHVKLRETNAVNLLIICSINWAFAFIVCFTMLINLAIRRLKFLNLLQLKPDWIRDRITLYYLRYVNNPQYLFFVGVENLIFLSYFLFLDFKQLQNVSVEKLINFFEITFFSYIKWFTIVCITQSHIQISIFKTF